MNPDMEWERWPGVLKVPSESTHLGGNARRPGVPKVPSESRDQEWDPGILKDPKPPLSGPFQGQSHKSWDRGW